MKASNINRLLFVSTLLMAVLPLMASLYFVDNALETSLNIGFNSQVPEVLDVSAVNLKKLAKLEPLNQEQYHLQFEQVQNLRNIYGSRDFVSKTIHHSLLIYFSIGLVAALIISTFAAALLSRRISSSFRVAHEQLAAQNEKIRYLEEISSWQELAKILAHEIKNPLTPIEMLITSLARSYHEQPAERFAEFMQHTQTVVLEELKQLKNTVQKFSAFARIPSIDAVRVNLVDVLSQQVVAINHVIERARVVFAAPCETNLLEVNLDTTLFRQVLSNLTTNGVEANPDKTVVFSVTLSFTEHDVTITMTNDGAPVNESIAPRMFDPYISSKHGKDNMGLGLAIARKIMLEHAGDIRYENRDGFPAFILTLPRLGS